MNNGTSPPASKIHEQPQEGAPDLEFNLSTPGPVAYNRPHDAVSVTSVTADLFPQTSGPLPPSSIYKQHKLGLDINYPLGWSGSAYDDYDVITVHGIRDDYKTAWIDEQGSWWVRDQLFIGLSVREIDYSYDIDEDSELYEPNGIIQHAQRLIQKYAEVRRDLDETEVDRPVIWICHDLGGTIVKEALTIAMNQCARYGKIPILTSAIVFLGTPHRFQSQDDLEDQLYKLVHLPGPEIRNRVVNKVKELAHQVDRINQNFLETKILDRAVVFNVLSYDTRSLRQGDVDDTATNDISLKVYDDLLHPVTPFIRYAHFVGQSFEAAGRISYVDIDHKDFIHGDTTYYWLLDVSNMLKCNLKVDHRIIRFQAQFLSLAPPTRALDTPFEPVLPVPPVVRWIYDQESFTRFSKRDVGLKIMHLHGNGDPNVNILEISRLFYVHYDSDITWNNGQRRPERTILYFEFDQWDSRYNSISSMLIYLINIILWRFWDSLSSFITYEMTFLNETCAWSQEDLYCLFTLLKDFVQITHQLTIFLCCFDQCLEDQRQWFLERVLENRSYDEARYGLIISTSAGEFPETEYFINKTSINLQASPTISESIHKSTKDLRLELANLIGRHPVYEDFLPRLENLLDECNDAPHIGHVILTWLGNPPRGRLVSGIAKRIDRLFPPTAENVVQVLTDSLEPLLQSRLKTIFNWVKHAAEPWSPKALIQALVVHESHGEEPSFEELDIEEIMRDIEKAFGGIIISTNSNVRFSHPSFHHVPDMGVEGSPQERAAKVNSTIAETCLCYIRLECAQEALATYSLENFEGGPWPTLLDATILSSPRTSMAEYAIRFWPQHYKASGQFKPTKLVQDLFSDRKARSTWEVAFWLFSNPTTRMQRSYISPLPIFAMLGLDDLVDERIEFERNELVFEKNCWFAITEAARTGNSELVRKLLSQVTADEEELQEALFRAAGNNNTDVIASLVDKIPDLKTFSWPRNILVRAAVVGLDHLLEVMLAAGCDINATSNVYQTTPLMVAIWRNQVSTVKLLLGSDPLPDLTIGDEQDTLITCAAKRGNPRTIELLLRSGVNVKAPDHLGAKPVQIAVENCKSKAVDILIKAGADMEGGATRGDAAFYARPLLTVAAGIGLAECVRILLHHGADINADPDAGTALYAAIERGHVDVARVLLEHDPKPNMDVTPPGRMMPLIAAISSRNAELVSLLIEHGAQVDCIDPSLPFYQTPLSWACTHGDLDIVKILLASGANINYTGETSYSPLFAAIWHRQYSVTGYLLQNEEIDLKWMSKGGIGHLVAAVARPRIIRELLRRGVPIVGDGCRATALHHAAFRGLPKSIEALLESDPKPDLDYIATLEDMAGHTALQLACERHRHECVEILLKGGANPNFKNWAGHDAVDILLLRTETNSKDALRCLDVLLSRIYNVPVDDVNEQGQTRLHRIQEKTPVSLIQRLVELGTPLDNQDPIGYTPLAIAAVKKNEDVARYLIEQGANVNILSPSFGSITHLAVAHSTLNIVKLLVDSGADLEAVDPRYGQSLLYTAFDIEDDSDYRAMVKYLVDEAKAPIDKLGGQLEYPIIRAAGIVKLGVTPDIRILKFLIRRGAQLNVADSQGRRAVHFVCLSWTDDAIKALVKAGAEIDVKDKFGRTPLHFAAASPGDQCFHYLLNHVKNIDINVTDHDNWTPLLWAARSGNSNTISTLIKHNADLWARGHVYGADAEWSALKLLNFANADKRTISELKPKLPTRINQYGEKEDWEDSEHNSEPGHMKRAVCKSCLVNIVGTQRKCIDCTHDFSLCFKCYSHRSDIHDREHSFEDIGPLYDEPLPWLGKAADDVEELLREESRVDAEELGNISDDLGW
ncbi:putative ankyrin repeat protein [Daldinia sp. FL1419]|nr:putative ankyrin repeat protein [Daldinia sp. FL1419]